MKTLCEEVKQIMNETVEINRKDAGLNKTHSQAFGEFPTEHIPGKLYHATFDKHLSSIKKTGLTPQTTGNFEGFSKGKKVSLAPDLESAKYWSSAALWRHYDQEKQKQKGDTVKVNKPVLLRISNTTGEKVRPDEVETDSVHPKNIEHWHNGKWKSLT
jgi:hypothetical protein